MAVRAIRGATQVDADDREQVLEATRELVSTVMERNELGHDDVITDFHVTGYPRHHRIFDLGSLAGE